MGGGPRDSKAAPTGLHRLLGYGVESPAYVPAGEEQGGAGEFGMFKAVDVDHERRVGAMTPAEAMLAGGECLVALPEVDNLANMYPHPELAKHFQQHERAKTVERDPIIGVFWFGAQPAPL